MDLDFEKAWEALVWPEAKKYDMFLDIFYDPFQEGITFFFKRREEIWASFLGLIFFPKCTPLISLEPFIQIPLPCSNETFTSSLDYTLCVPAHFSVIYRTAWTFGAELQWWRAWQSVNFRLTRLIFMPAGSMNAVNAPMSSFIHPMLTRSTGIFSAYNGVYLPRGRVPQKSRRN